MTTIDRFDVASKARRSGDWPCNGQRADAHGSYIPHCLRVLEAEYHATGRCQSTISYFGTRKASCSMAAKLREDDSKKVITIDAQHTIEIMPAMITASVNWVQDLIDEFGVLDENIWNMDEIVNATGPCSD